MKRIVAFISAVFLCAALAGQAWATEGQAMPPASPADTPASPPVSPTPPGPEESSAEPAEEVPEETPAAEGPENSIYDFLDDSSLSLELDLVAYYLEEMSSAAAAGDVQAGHEAEKNRNDLIDLKGSGQEKIAFDDLYLLAKLINAEAGSDWLNDDFRLCVGEVVLNRVASPEFPNSIEEVIYQKGQYSSTGTAAFASLVPSQNCVDVALRLLQGERKMAPSVVFQSGYEQGEIFSMYQDRRLGTTFFCVSANLDLYPVEAS